MDDRERLEAIVKVVRQYLPPDGISVKEAMGKIIELVDPLPPRKKSFNEDVGRLLSTGKGFYDDGTPIDPDEIQMKIQGVGDEVFVCTEVHLPRPPKREWVGLTDKERADWHAMGLVGVELVAAHLEEKNRG